MFHLQRHAFTRLHGLQFCTRLCIPSSVGVRHNFQDPLPIGPAFHPVMITAQYSSVADPPGGNPRHKRINIGNLMTAIGLSAFVILSFASQWYFNQDADHDEVMGRLKKKFGFRTEAKADQLTPSATDPKPSSQPTISQPEHPSTQQDAPNCKPEAVPSDISEDEDDAPSIVYRDESRLGFPHHVRYLIVGAGSAGMAAARAIRASDPLSKILMIAGGPDEPGLPETNDVEPPPYLRPPLSKELWRRNKERESIVLQSSGDMRRHSWLYYEPESYFSKPEELPTLEFGGVALVRGDPVVHLDSNYHRVTLSSGRHITYDRCLLATGGTPKRVTSLEYCPITGKNLVEAGLLSYFRSIGDYRRLRDLVEKYRNTGGKIAVIGGGFLGSELTISLLTKPVKAANPEVATTSNLSVTHVFRESAPMGHVLPPSLAAATARFESSKGAELWPSSEVVSISTISSPTPTPVIETKKGEKRRFRSLHAVTATQAPSERVRLRLRQGDRVEEIDVDHVVCAVGIQPNVALAESAGLEVDPRNGGFLVNAEMEARAGIFAAGDAASYWDPVLGFRRRVEHLNFAEETGQLAGKNMAAPFVARNDEANTKTAATLYEPARYQYQSSCWSSLGPEVSWDAVGNVNSHELITRSFFANAKAEESDPSTDGSLSVPSAELGRLTRGVVFYMTPKDKRLVGILLWNLPDELYSDSDYASPSRLNIARYLLAEKLKIGQSKVKLSEEEELRLYASYFDLPGDLAREYAEIKAHVEQKERDAISETEQNLNESVEFAGQQ